MFDYLRAIALSPEQTKDLITTAAGNLASIHVCHER
jgi:hypothetical protein